MHRYINFISHDNQLRRETYNRDVQKYWSLELSWPCPRFRELLADMSRRSAVAEQHAGNFCNLGQALSTGKFTLEP